MPESVLVRVRDAVADAAAALAEAGCDTPRLDAELLLAEALGGVGRERLVLDALSPLDPVVSERLADLVARRAAREPVAYILGRKEFRRITLAVDSRVLIPRPETELLVEVGLSLPVGATVVDVGTGSGAVALTLKHERPDLRVWGVDLSAAAVTVARDNAARLDLDVHFVQADLLAGVDELVAQPDLLAGVGPGPAQRRGPTAPRGRFYAILANLPYVPDGTPVAPEIERYEPAGALFGGADGLDVIRRLLRMVGGAGARTVARAAGGRAAGGTGAPPVRATEGRPPGATVVALEVGAGQADAVAQLVHEAGFRSVERLRDLAGHERVVVGRR